MSGDPKFCEDCRFFCGRKKSGENDYCIKPRALVGRDVVRRGEASKRICDVERDNTGADYCSMEAKWFEASVTPDQEDAELERQAANGAVG